jgi:membrane protein YdbS with pleckstrin-like domain
VNNDAGATGGDARGSSDALLPAREAWRVPSTRLRSLRIGEAAAVAVVGVAVVVVVESGAGAPTGDVALSVVAVVAAGVAAAVVLGRRVASWGYAERDDDLIVRRGVLVRRLSVVPYGRMQYVEVTAGLLERSLGLATVRMHTAAAASDARIPGLERTESARLRDRLTVLGEARAAGL